MENSNPLSEVDLGSKVDVTALRSQNHLRPINRIPPEIMLEIFFTALENSMGDSKKYGPSESWGYSVEYYRELQTLRLVAFGWSVLIDRTPRFWTYVDVFAREETWRMALQRSQDASVNVDCMSRSRPSDARLPPAFMKEFSNHTPRIRALSIMERDFGDIPLYESEMAALVSLYVRRYMIDIDQIERRSPIISLARWAPQVRSVELIGCSVNWPNPGWTNLVSLKLVHGDPATVFDTFQLLNILSGSPALQHITLQGQLATPAPEAAQLPQVHLGKLKTLKCSTFSTRGLFQLLDSITAFPTEQFNIGFFVKNTEPFQLRTFGKFASRLKGKHRETLGLTASGDHCQIRLGGFSVRAAFGGTPELAFNALDAILEGMPGTWLKEVDRVDLTDVVGIVAPSLLPVVHTRCPTVHYLSLWSFNSGVATSFGRNVPGWLFPHVTTVSLPVNLLKPHMLGIAGAIRARLEAYKAGILPEKVKKLVLKDSFGQRTGFEDLVQEAQRLIPEVIVEI